MYFLNVYSWHAQKTLLTNSSFENSKEVKTMLEVTVVKAAHKGSLASLDELLKLQSTHPSSWAMSTVVNTIA